MIKNVWIDESQDECVEMIYRIRTHGRIAPSTVFKTVAINQLCHPAGCSHPFLYHGEYCHLQGQKRISNDGANLHTVSL